jgi:hypothetical protein
MLKPCILCGWVQGVGAACAGVVVCGGGCRGFVRRLGTYAGVGD